MRGYRGGWKGLGGVWVAVVLAATILTAGCGSETGRANALIGQANAKVREMESCSVTLGTFVTSVTGTATALTEAAAQGASAGAKTCLEKVREARDLTTQAKGLKLAETDRQYLAASAEALDATASAFALLEKDFIPAMGDLVEVTKALDGLKNLEAIIDKVVRDIDAGRFDQARASVSDLQKQMETVRPKAVALAQKLSETQVLVAAIDKMAGVVRSLGSLVEAIQQRDQAKVERALVELERTANELEPLIAEMDRVSIDNTKVWRDVDRHFQLQAEAIKRAQAAQKQGIKVTPLDLEVL